MKKILTTMAALSALAAAAPAAAQYGQQQNGYGNQGNQGWQNGARANANMAARIQQLRMRLDAGVRMGTISRREAAQLDRQIRDLSTLERRYARNGISREERQDLRQRMQGVRQQIRQADGGNQARWEDYDRQDGYGRYDRDDEYGQYGQYPQGGQYDSNGQYGGGYQQPVQNGGIGGLIQGLLGGGGLRVGQRATANLGGVPYEYQDQYRDGNGTYFRSDGRQIYQIDARTQTVVRVYAMRR